jgi:hypothetical protein
MKAAMDKRKVIAAYRQGTITLQECAQIIGMDSAQMNRLVNDPVLLGEPNSLREKRKATS